MRLIDADILKDSIMFTCDLGGWIGETLLQIKKLAVKYIETAPTIDAVEVVRCRGCKYWHSNTEFCDVWSCLNVSKRTLKLDYCSRGRRREDGDDGTR